MSTALETRPPGRHAWLDRFAADPINGFGELLAGTAPVFPYTRADAPDAARMLFGPLPSGDPAREALLRGALGWLTEARRSPLPADPAELQDRVRAVCEAFAIVAALGIAPAAATLRHEYPRWSDWAAGMVLAPSRDAREAHWRMLAQTQIQVAGSVSNPDALAPLWMRLCREAGGELPERYLQIGLLGLRRLPGATARGDVPWIAGLAAWALARKPSEKQFLRVWLPFRRLYPSTPATLRKQVFNVLGQKPFQDAGIEPPEWWAADPELARGRTKPLRVAFEPPSREVYDKLLDDIQNGAPFRQLAPRVRQLIEGYRIFAERSGDPYHLVRSSCNIGMQLIRHGDDARRQRASVAQVLAREALNHRPDDRFAWSLWRDALVAEGALEAARMLGWEKVRRFPDDPNSRNQLAELLGKQLGTLGEAEVVARETVARFPDDAFARNELAELLIAQNRVGEAQVVVEATIGAGVANSATYAILVRLRAARNDFDGAWLAVDAGLRLDRGNDFPRGFKARLDRGEAPALVSAAYRRRPSTEDTEPGDAAPDDVLRGGRLRALRERIERDAAAIGELKAVFEEDPTFAYAQLLAARHRLWRAEADTLPPVAVAFEAALADGDRARLEALAEHAPRLQALILVARALLGDGEAARQAALLIGAADDTGGDHGLRILRARLKPVLTVIGGGVEPLDAIQANADRIRQAIYDTNEALAAPELIAA